MTLKLTAPAKTKQKTKQKTRHIYEYEERAFIACRLVDVSSMPIYLYRSWILKPFYDGLAFLIVEGQTGHFCSTKNKITANKQTNNNNNNNNQKQPRFWWLEKSFLPFLNQWNWYFWITLTRSLVSCQCSLSYVGKLKSCVMGIQSACVRVMLRDQDLCETESRWMSWAPVPNKPAVSVDVKNHSANHVMTDPKWRILFSKIWFFGGNLFFVRVPTGYLEKCPVRLNFHGWCSDAIANSRDIVYFPCLSIFLEPC